MNIEHAKVVTFEYVLYEQEESESDANGSEIERSEPDSPIRYLHGSPSLLQALQEGLAGHTAGTEHTVDIPPERAYGIRKDNSIHRIPLKHVIGNPCSNQLKAGQVI